MRAGVKEDIMDLDTCCMLDYKSFQCKPNKMSRENTNRFLVIHPSVYFTTHPSLREAAARCREMQMRAGGGRKNASCTGWFFLLVRPNTTKCQTLRKF